MAVRLWASRVGRLYSLETFFSASGTHFCYRLGKPQGLVRPEELGKMKKKIYDLIGNRTRNLPACSIAPQPVTHGNIENEH
jgi:hypothetical protein